MRIGFLFILSLIYGCSSLQKPESSRSLASVEEDKPLFESKNPAEVGFMFAALQLYSELDHAGFLTDKNVNPPVCLNRPELGSHPAIDVSIQTDGSFKLGQAVLNPKQEQKFVQTAAIALNNTYRFMRACWKTEKFQTEITGFADGVPLRRKGKTSLEANQELALERACVLAVILTNGSTFQDFKRCDDLLNQRSIRPRNIETGLIPEISGQLRVSSIVDPEWIAKKINSAEFRKVSLKVSSTSNADLSDKNGISQIEPQIKIAEEESQFLFQEAARASALAGAQNLPLECQNDLRTRKTLNTLALNKNARIDPSDFFCFDVSSVFYDLIHKGHAQLIDVKKTLNVRVNPKTLQSYGKHTHRGFYCADCGSGSRYDESTGLFKIEPRWLTQGFTFASGTRSAFVAFLIHHFFKTNTNLDSGSGLDRLIYKTAVTHRDTSYWVLNRSKPSENQMLLEEIQVQLSLLLAQDSELKPRHQRQQRIKRTPKGWQNATAVDMRKLKTRLNTLQELPETWLESLHAFQWGEASKHILESVAEKYPLSYAAQMQPLSWEVPLSCKQVSALDRHQLSQLFQTLNPIRLTAHGENTHSITPTSPDQCLISFPVAQACGSDPSGLTEGSWNKEFKEAIACSTGIQPSQVPELRDFAEFIRSINHLRSSAENTIQVPLMGFTELEAKAAIEALTCRANPSSN